jgi:hypothetical protein
MNFVPVRALWNRTLCIAAVATIAVAASALPARAQAGGAGGADMQARMMELKESMAKNKAALATYTWKETATISLKGEVKKVQHYQVREGADGKSQKTSLDPAEAPQQPQGGRLRQRVVAKKKEEFEDYAEKMKTTAGMYVPPDKELIQAAYQKGNVAFAPDGPNVKITFTNYVKPGDSMTILFDKAKKQISSIAIKTYMDDPSDGLTLNVNFDALPDGTSHVSSTTVVGVSKELTVATVNNDYQKL